MNDFDAPVFSLAEVASLAGISDLKLAANWTDRALVDPHVLPGMRRRGRGRERLFSIRDVGRFALMRDLSDRYSVSVSVGRRICENVLGDFNPKNPGIFIVGKATAEGITTEWCADIRVAARWLLQRRVSSVLLVSAYPLVDVWERAVRAFEAKSDGRAHE